MLQKKLFCVVIYTAHYKVWSVMDARAATLNFQTSIFHHCPRQKRYWK